MSPLVQKDRAPAVFVPWPLPFPMSWWTTEDSFVAGPRQGDPATLRGTPWWSLKRFFDRVHGDSEVLVLTIPPSDGAVSPCTRTVHLCDRTQSPATLIGLVRDAVEQDARSLWIDERTEARFWTVWYRLMTGMSHDDAKHCNRGILFLAELVASAYTHEPLHLCDTRFSEENLNAINHLDNAASNKDEDGIKTYGYICLKLWERYEDRFSEWLRCQFVLKALKCARDPYHDWVLQSHARFRSPPGRLADLVRHLNSTGWSALIKRHYVRASSCPNPLRSPALPPSPGDESSTLEVFYDGLHAASYSSTLYKGVQVKRDGTYQFVAVKVMSERAEKPEQLSQLHAWFRDANVRKVLSEPVDGTQAPVFPNFGVHETRPNRFITVSPWARHENVRRYVQERVKETQADNWRVNEIVLDLMEQLLSAVQGVHDAGLVHGNLKGANILITENAVLQLADFGSYSVSCAPECAANRSSIPWHKRMMEKSGVFMSPQLRKSGITTVESDMWAVSCVFLELYLAAFSTFRPEGHVLEAADMDQLHPGIPRDIWGLIRTNWLENPSRCLSAMAMHRRLDQIRDKMQAGFRNRVL